VQSQLKTKAALLGVTAKEYAEWVANNLEGQPENIESEIRALDYILRRLLQLLENEENVLYWMQTANKHPPFLGQSPKRHLISSGTEGILKYLARFDL